MTRQELIDSPVCDGKCPSNGSAGVVACCAGCLDSRREFYTNGGLPEFTPGENDIVRAAWDEKTGFWSKNGCRLPRKLMPSECLEYDCKASVFEIAIKWDGKKWRLCKLVEYTKG